jgi:hypothetical protein
MLSISGWVDMKGMFVAYPQPEFTAKVKKKHSLCATIPRLFTMRGSNLDMILYYIVLYLQDVM